jgi:hypothetical protein
MHIVAPILAGLVLLLFGRRLFWLFVGVAGFLGGWYLAKVNLHLEPETTLMIVALVVGLICAVLSIFLQKLAITIAGFFSGGYLAMNLVYSLGFQLPIMIAFVIGGIIGAFLVWVIFDWALILLSSLTGALLLSQAVTVYHVADIILISVFVIAFIIGVAAQAAQLRLARSGSDLEGRDSS